MAMQVWAINDYKTDASAARAAQYVQFKGEAGVVQPRDMKVVATETPSDEVMVMPGGCTMPNYYLDGGGGQQYAVYSDETVNVSIDETDSSGGKTRYLGARIVDPQYSGDEVQVEYFVTTKKHSNDPANPWVPLAKIDQPKSTATIENDMIEDLRRVAVPRTETHVIPRAALSGDEGLGLSKKGGDGEWFPNIGDVYVNVPAWATRLLIEAHWTGVNFTDGNAYGQFWVEYGEKESKSVREHSTQTWQFNGMSVSDNYRQNWILHSTQKCPKDIRGEKTLFVYKARYDEDSSHKGVKLDGRSGVSLNIMFAEEADQDIEWAYEGGGKGGAGA